MKGFYAGILAALLALPMMALANDGVADGLYYGVYLTQIRYSDDVLQQTAVDDTWTPFGGTLQLGYGITDRFAVEGRIGRTARADQSYGQNELAFQVNYYASVFGRFNITTGRARLYALLGGTWVRASWHGDLPALGVSGRIDDEEETDISYGVGLSLYGTEHIAVTAEYIRHIQKSDYYIDAANLGFTYNF